MFDPMTAAIGVGGTLLGGMMASDAASSAANAQVASAQQASDTQRYMFDRARADNAPWRDTGKASLNRLSYLMGLSPAWAANDPAAYSSLTHKFSIADFNADPGYQFRLSEGQKAINNSLLARGGALSGAAIKAAERFNQNLASQEYANAYNRFNQDQSNRFNRLAALSGIGQTAAQQIGNWGMNAGNNIAANQIGAGNAQAAGAIGSANAWNNAINQGLSLYGMYR